MNVELIDFLIKKKSIYYSDEPIVMKSGAVLHFDTDIRTAMSTVSDLRILSALIYNSLPQEIKLSNSTIVGVPETGHILSFGLSYELAQHTNHAIPINLIRALPKEYQGERSINTVLPISKKNQPLVIIEDDIVTGNTVKSLINRLHSFNIRYVISVIDRTDKIKMMIENDYGISYYRCISLEGILIRLRDTSINNNLISAIEKYIRCN